MKETTNDFSKYIHAVKIGENMQLSDKDDICIETYPGCELSKEEIMSEFEEFDQSCLAHELNNFSFLKHIKDKKNIFSLLK